jgi:hypothetical protein
LGLVKRRVALSGQHLEVGRLMVRACRVTLGGFSSPLSTCLTPHPPAEIESTPRNIKTISGINVEIVFDISCP